MSRTQLVIFVALGAALAGLAISSTASRIRSDDTTSPASTAAGPQVAELDWRETYGSGSQRLVFVVESLEVADRGWSAKLALHNDTTIAYELGDPRATLDRSFGLMLFSTGDPEELEQRNAGNTLPAIRAATRYEPDLPQILEPGASWEGRISASGALAAGSWVRVVFGALVAVAKPPEGMGEFVVWITDHAYRLRR